MQDKKKYQTLFTETKKERHHSRFLCLLHRGNLFTFYWQSAAAARFAAAAAALVRLLVRSSKKRGIGPTQVGLLLPCEQEGGLFFALNFATPLLKVERRKIVRHP